MTELIPLCRVQYIPLSTAPNIRTIRCGLPAGHHPNNVHEETGTGVTWTDHGPSWQPSRMCTCQTVTSGVVIMPDCPIHAGAFGAEVVKLRAELAAARAEIERLTAERVIPAPGTRTWSTANAVGTSQLPAPGDDQ
jgi:hypothetical protein